jgi:hypothetical protein
MILRRIAERFLRRYQGVAGEKAKERAKWLEVFERVQKNDEFFDRQDKAFADWIAGNEPEFSNSATENIEEGV